MIAVDGYSTDMIPGKIFTYICQLRIGLRIRAPSASLIGYLPIRRWPINTLVLPTGPYQSNTHQLQSCLDAAKEARLRESQRPAHPGPDFSSQLDVSTVSSARATMPSV